MATVTRIEGLEHALKQFQQAPDIARKHIGDAIRQTEIVLAQKVRSAAPVLTGALRQSIGSKTVGLKAQITIEEGDFYGDNRPSVYWRFVEFGTYKMPAQPYIRPASETEFTPMVERVKRAAVLVERELTIP